MNNNKAALFNVVSNYIRNRLQAETKNPNSAESYEDRVNKLIRLNKAAIDMDKQRRKDSNARR